MPSIHPSEKHVLDLEREAWREVTCDARFASGDFQQLRAHSVVPQDPMVLHLVYPPQPGQEELYDEQYIQAKFRNTDNLLQLFQQPNMPLRLGVSADGNNVGKNGNEEVEVENDIANRNKNGARVGDTSASGYAKGGHATGGDGSSRVKTTTKVEVNSSLFGGKVSWETVIMIGLILGAVGIAIALVWRFYAWCAEKCSPCIGYVTDKALLTAEEVEKRRLGNPGNGPGRAHFNNRKKTVRFDPEPGHQLSNTQIFYHDGNVFPSRTSFRENFTNLDDLLQNRQRENQWATAGGASSVYPDVRNLPDPRDLGYYPVPSKVAPMIASGMARPLQCQELPHGPAWVTPAGAMPMQYAQSLSTALLPQNQQPPQLIAPQQQQQPQQGAGGQQQAGQAPPPGAPPAGGSGGNAGQPNAGNNAGNGFGAVNASP